MIIEIGSRNCADLDFSCAFVTERLETLATSIADQLRTPNQREPNELPISETRQVLVSKLELLSCDDALRGFRDKLHQASFDMVLHVASLPGGELRSLRDGLSLFSVIVFNFAEVSSSSLYWLVEAASIDQNEIVLLGPYGAISHSGLLDAEFLNRRNFRMVPSEDGNLDCLGLSSNAELDWRTGRLCSLGTM